MTINLNSFVACLFLGTALSAPLAQAASIQFTPTILNTPIGGINGFGFSFDNDGAGYAVLDYTSFVQQVDGFGAYVDILGTEPNLVVANPNQTLNQSFNPNTPLGAGEYSFLNSVTPGTTINGTMTLFYDLYSLSPYDSNFDPYADYLSSAKVSQTVLILAFQPASATPEPSILGLIGVGLLVFGIAARRRPATVNR